MIALETFGVMFLKGVVLPALGILAVWAATNIPKWIATKIANARVAGVIDRLFQLATTVVQEIQQTVISNMDPEDKPVDQLVAARDQAIATLKSHLGPKGLLEVKNAMQLSDDTAVEKLIVSFIESAVLTLRMQEPKL